jgi:peptidyl-prolyl cis-trans isomerase SurA
MKEYHDGMLLFDITDEKVWSKAVKDTIGLQDFYDKNKSNYKWDERIHATIYTCANEQIANNVRKLLQDSKLSNKEILDSINKTSELNLQILENKFSKKDNEIIDDIEWKPGITDNIKKDKSVVFVVVHEKLNPEFKTLSEAKGIITADYQNFLEEQWLKELKQKYPVEINQELLNTVK